MDEPDPIAKGYWCTNCEFFEDELFSEFENDVCRSCGCPADSHTVVIVKAVIVDD